MEMNQKIEQTRLLIPELRKSLGVLTLSSIDVRSMLEQELESNPLLEEALPDMATGSLPVSSRLPRAKSTEDLSFQLSILTNRASLRDVLSRQLGMFANSDEDIILGQEIIENIDENGYFRASLDDISRSLNVTNEVVENVLKLIQKFEPPGVGARNVNECLLIQLDFAKDNDPLMRKIIELHLPDVAKKNYGKIAKALNEPLEKIESLIKRILKLDPKPGRNYAAEENQNIIPDATIDQKDDVLDIIMNDENIPVFRINKTYEDMLTNNNLDSKTKEFLKERLLNAMELLRSISKRRSTLTKVIRTVAEIQQDAVRNGPSHLKPLAFAEVAQRLKMHETTVCRAVMNKYIRLPWGTISLKNFFPSHISDKNGQAISSAHTKHLIKELIDKEDKKNPLSDQDIAKYLASENNLNVSRRTIAKYREELKILSSSFRRER